MPSLYFRGEKLWSGMALPSKDTVPYQRLRFSMINKVATTHCSFLRRQIKREDISTNAVSVTKTELYTILRDVCIVLRDVCIVSNRLTCIDAKLSEMETLAQPLSLPFIIENLISAGKVAPNGERRKLANEQAGESQESRLFRRSWFVYSKSPWLLQ
jgi:hypothetical protein